jgi:integrase
MGKRGHGEGSIYQIKDGGWRGAVTQGRKPNGKPNIKTVSGDTRKEVALKLDKLIADHRKGIVSAPERLTVAMHAANWLRDTIAPMDQPNTYDYYEGETRRHVIPAIGHIRLNNLRPDHVRKMLNDRREMDSRFGRPYSRRTIKAIHETISAMLEQAVRDGLLEKNVAKLVRTNDGDQVKEQQANFAMPTGEESVHLLTAIEQHPWKCFIVVSMMLGIRRGEVVALRWRDIDLEGGWVSVWNEIQRVKVKRLKVQPASRFSGAGSRMTALKAGSRHRRDVEISPLVREALLEQRERQQAQRAKAGDKWKEQDFVFSARYGDHWHPDTATKVFAELREQAGLSATIHLHSLRHGFASAMLRQGVHPKLVQEQLGHSRIGTTLDKYSHFLPGARSVIPATMEAHLAEGRETLRQNPITPKIPPIATAITTKAVLEMPRKVG